MEFTFDFSPKWFAAKDFAEIFRDFVTVWGSNRHRQTVRVRPNGLLARVKNRHGAWAGGSGVPRMSGPSGLTVNGRKLTNWGCVESLCWSARTACANATTAGFLWPWGAGDQYSVVALWPLPGSCAQCSRCCTGNSLPAHCVFACNQRWLGQQHRNLDQMNAQCTRLLAI